MPAAVIEQGNCLSWFPGTFKPCLFVPLQPKSVHETSILSHSLINNCCHVPLPQVLCTMQTWNASCLSSSFLENANNSTLLSARGLALESIIGTSLGPHALKGITDRVQLVQCKLDKMLLPDTGC